jgi:hypothetical protein
MTEPCFRGSRFAHLLFLDYGRTLPPGLSLTCVAVASDWLQAAIAKTRKEEAGNGFAFSPFLGFAMDPSRSQSPPQTSKPSRPFARFVVHHDRNAIRNLTGVGGSASFDTWIDVP